MRTFNKVAASALCLAAHVCTHAQSVSSNYIMHSIYLDSMSKDSAVTVTYYDGLGRMAERVSSQGHGKYSSALTEYDGLGRAVEQWLPAPSGDTPGMADAAALKNSAMEFYSDCEPHTSYSYDAIDRAVKVTRPGQDWHTGKSSRSVETRYSTNTSNEVKNYVGQNGKLTDSGWVTAGTLDVETTVDEDGRSVSVYRNMHGDVVLERRGGTSQTYYVYNDIGELCFVLTPAYQECEDEEMNAYEYRYDSHGRCVWKRMPGAEPQRYGYDAANRVVFSQDGNQHDLGKATFFAYDAWGRLAVRGVCSMTEPHSIGTEATATFTGNAPAMGYACDMLATLNSATYLEANYYDDYSFRAMRQYRQSGGLDFVSKAGYSAGHGTAKGLLTGRFTLADIDGGKSSLAVYYYDNEERMVENLSVESEGTSESHYVQYNFAGNVSRQLHEHRLSDSAQPLTEERFHSYKPGTTLPHMSSYCLNGAPMAYPTVYSYDGIGRLQSVSIGRCKGMTTTYKYNVRSWLTESSSQYFRETLHYNDGAYNNRRMFSGNIASAGVEYNGGDSCWLAYSYDNLDRLVSATRNNAGNPFGGSMRYSYDTMGNITEMDRALTVNRKIYSYIDKLRFSYYGNQIEKIKDEAGNGDIVKGAFKFVDGADEDTEYWYDSNGNMAQDLNKGIRKITYNALNLPGRIDFSNGNYIKYSYDSDGVKTEAVYGTRVGTVIGFPSTHAVSGSSISGNEIIPGKDIGVYFTSSKKYCGNVVYDGTRLDKVLTDEGYVTFTSAEGNTEEPRYHFYVRDHLGNVCMVVDGSGNVEQRNYYNPYGGIITTDSTTDVQPYKYIGKELDRMYGLDWYDHGARWYDSKVGRWWAMDPLAERHYWVSPYASCHDNPVSRLDPDGLDDIFSKTGVFQYRTRTGTSVLMDVGDGNLANITDIDFRNQKVSLLNIASHYMSMVDANAFAMNVSEIMGQVPANAALSNSQGTNKYDIYINDKGKVNSALGDCYNFENSAYHESRHRYDSNTHGGTLGEVEAVLQETEHPSWSNVSMSYIHAQASYAANRLNEYLKKIMEKEEKSHKNGLDIEYYVNLLNKAFIGFASFSIEDNTVSVSNNIKNVEIVWPSKK